MQKYSQLKVQDVNTMRWSQYFIPTLREDPADAEVVSHKLLLRAGIIRQLSAGIYSYLPLGQRIALKVMQILREEMNAIGGQEFFLPALHPAVDPTDPYASLDYAARLMRGYLGHFGNWTLALIAYNAGPGRLMPGNPAYLPTATLLSNSFGGGETKRYVARILGR